MKLILASLCFILACVGFLPEAHSKTSSASELVRVRLLSVPSKVLISGQALRVQNLSPAIRPVAIPQANSAEVRLLEKDGKNLWALRFQNQEREQIFSAKYLLVQGEGLRVGAQSLPSRILLSANKNQSVDVVGVLPLEDYVVGVLASEMPLTWPLETLKAQAVAARSYALAVMAERKEKPYHLESNILDQVYRHVLSEDEDSPLIKKAVQAARETQGQKLYGSNSKVLKAFFHSDCGGKTTTAQNVWSHGVNSGVAEDRGCPSNPKGKWHLSLNEKELAEKIGVSGITGIQLLKAANDNRVHSVLVALNDGTQTTLSANGFRQKLGFQSLRSSLFEVNKEGTQFHFSGQGLGHGVGLCQWGSRALGIRGMSYKQILAHYYPLAKLQ